MQVDTRVFCPVPTCPCADPLRARGWRSVHTMQSHIDAHMAGSISGDVPAAWLAQHNRQRCAVCGLSVACRFGIHPTCRPEARAAMAGHMQDTEPGTDSLPPILEIHGSNSPTSPARCPTLVEQSPHPCLGARTPPQHRGGMEAIAHAAPSSLGCATVRGQKTSQGPRGLHIGPPGPMARRGADGSVDQPALSTQTPAPEPYSATAAGTCHRAST